MSSVIERERQLYSDVFTGIDQYADHSPGEQHVSLFLEMARITDPEHFSVLDAGCGSGKGALGLQSAGFQVRMCDITPEGLIDEARDLPFQSTCLWHSLGPRVDFVYCTDVLEHIPTEFTMLVISRLLEVSRRGVFLSISLMPDVFGYQIGQPLHHTVRPFSWWRDNISAIGQIQECRDLLHTGVFWVTAA
jgi:SAM-dependent methyltransferase